jgi:predicted chitinase
MKILVEQFIELLGLDDFVQGKILSGIKAMKDKKEYPKLGDKGFKVTAIQKLLKDFGISGVKLNGKYDSEMKKFIEQYQKTKGLKVNGEITDEFFNSILQEKPGSPIDTSKKDEVKTDVPKLKGKIKHNYSGVKGGVVNSMIDEMTKVGLTNPYAQVAILSTIDKESGFIPQSENPYSKTSNSKLRNIFGKRVKHLSDDQLSKLKNDPKEFFKVVYSKVAGNQGGDDGWMYRGRGLNQLTGKGNYSKYGNLIGKDLVSNPDLVNDPKIASEIAVKFLIKDISKENQFTNLDDAIRHYVKLNAGGSLKDFDVTKEKSKNFEIVG